MQYSKLEGITRGQVAMITVKASKGDSVLFQNKIYLVDSVLQSRYGIHYLLEGGSIAPQNEITFLVECNPES